eukprot:461715_1
MLYMYALLFLFLSQFDKIYLLINVYSLLHFYDFSLCKIMSALAVKYRNKVIEELVITEKKYINGLNNLIKIFIEPLEENDVISNNDFHILFPKDIKTIYNLHTILLTEFQKQFKNLSTNNDCNIGKIFIEHAAMFKMYQNYLNNHHKTTQKLSQLQQKKKFIKWCNKAQSKINNQTLGSLLILPIQRIPRYELLLKELIKRTEKLSKRHKHLNDLNKALKNISEINQIVNDRMKHYEQREKVKQIKQRFDLTTLKIEIITPSRYFIMDNYEKNKKGEKIIIKHNKFGNEINIYMILFNDGILYGHIKSLNITNSCKYIFDNFLPFNNVFEINNIGNIYRGLHCIKILSSIESIWISFKCNKYKMEWINNINNSLNIKLKKNKNIKNDINEKELIQMCCLIPDDFSDNCMECNIKFSITNRRHHCYMIKCGKLVCGVCSDFKISDPKSNIITEQIRICKSCYVKYKQQTRSRLNKIEILLKNNMHLVILVIIGGIIFKQQIWNLLLQIIQYILTHIF